MTLMDLATVRHMRACHEGKGRNSREGGSKLQAASDKLQAHRRLTCSLGLIYLREAAAFFAPRWRWASNRHTPVATDTLRLLTLPAIGKFTR